MRAMMRAIRRLIYDFRHQRPWANILSIICIAGAYLIGREGIDAVIEAVGAFRGLPPHLGTGTAFLSLGFAALMLFIAWKMLLEARPNRAMNQMMSEAKFLSTSLQDIRRRLDAASGGQGPSAELVAQAIQEVEALPMIDDETKLKIIEGIKRRSLPASHGSGLRQ